MFISKLFEAWPHLERQMAGLKRPKVTKDIGWPSQLWRNALPFHTHWLLVYVKEPFGILIYTFDGDYKHPRLEIVLPCFIAAAGKL